ncbi:PHD finger protein 15 [Giardia muris]|uniref:PHD finger protein 15 n=1 Tax=Giardia muris TaxID=5742 RepID=A0A4Z1SSH2_GIAMU|nr:PHD finger protein 15 [Giardia muris]|eukprot:TNJ28720.1 PHD finger protein 15 [Giardia muris]
MLLGGEDVCDICLSAESITDDPIVYCDGCDCAVHCSCYGVTEAELAAPSWFCRACASSLSERRCFLCGKEMDRISMKEYQVASGGLTPRFAHCICFRLYPGLVYDPEAINLVVSTATHIQIEVERAQAVRRACAHCQEAGDAGIVIRCRAPTGCVAEYHPLCMVLAGGGFWLETFETHNVIYALCPRHRGENWDLSQRNNKSHHDALVVIEARLLRTVCKPLVRQELGAHIVEEQDLAFTNSHRLLGLITPARAPAPTVLVPTRGGRAVSLPAYADGLLRCIRLQISACRRCRTSPSTPSVVNESAFARVLTAILQSRNTLENLLAISPNAPYGLRAADVCALALFPGLIPCGEIDAPEDLPEVLSGERLLAEEGPTALLLEVVLPGLPVPACLVVRSTEPGRLGVAACRLPVVLVV